MGISVRLRQVVVDAVDIRPLAEFYRELLGWDYRSGDQAPPAGDADPNGSDWLVLVAPEGAGIAFQQVSSMDPPTWPEGDRPQMLHLDLSVPDASTLSDARERVVALGGRVLFDRFDDPEEPLYVFADLAGHPFCIFVAP